MDERDFRGRVVVMEYAEKGWNVMLFVAPMRFIDEITWFCCRTFSRDLRRRFAAVEIS
jgi:hypothetical protein